MIDDECFCFVPGIAPEPDCPIHGGEEFYDPGPAIYSAFGGALERPFSEEEERRKRHARALKRWPVVGW
jgi:hypothetical protein